MTTTTVIQTFIIRHDPYRTCIGRYYSTQWLYTNDVEVVEKATLLCGST